MKYWFIILLLIRSFAIYAQTDAEGTAKPLSENDNGFATGIYAGPNLTWVKGWDNYSLWTYEKLRPKIGYDINIVTKYNLYKKLFLTSGISYEVPKYETTNIQTVIFPPTGNEYYITNYYLSVPLLLDYEVAHHNKWELYTGAGVEFYWNFEGIIESNASSPVTSYLTQGHVATILGKRENNYYWSALGAFGIIHARLDYKVSPKLSISCMPIYRFTDPFAPNPFRQFIIDNARQNTFSMNFGINYNFPYTIRTGALFEGDKSKKKFSIGFDVIPTYRILKLPSLPSGYVYPFYSNYHFSFSYAFPLQYDLSKYFKLETGIAIDNFNYLSITSNILIGLPIILRYNIPLDEAQHNSLYIGLGCHIDYPTNIGWLYDPAHPFILPLALGKIGYQVTFGGNYYMDASLGYEVSFNDISASGGNFVYYYWEPTLRDNPNYLFMTIGMGYKF